LGLLYRELNDFENSISCYESAIKINPQYANAHHNLAEIFKEVGNFEKSIESSMLAIKWEPNNLMNYYFLSELKKDILDSNLKNKIKKNIENKMITASNNAYGNYLLAKYERSEKNHKKEFDYLIKGHLNFYISKKERFDLNIKYCFDDVIKISKEAKVEEAEEINKYNVKPIFIFGVPRSGSTLVEKIIASGKNFIPIGEEIGVIGSYVISQVLKKESLVLGKSDDLRNELYEIYKEKNLIFKKYKYTFTDKSLDNFFYLKIIKSVYPNAKLINCQRDVLSSIMSIFQNNLTTLSWAHDLDNIFKYFDNYFEIVESYNKENPNQIYNLCFEKLVNNPEEESKKLMSYCDLPWDKKCLEFHKRKDLISKTASNIQIREAIYKHPTEKYLPYKKLLDKYGEKYSWFK
jgi:tetratricopeptide (TPR) repeat protein